jgi:hypothetical protein
MRPEFKVHMLNASGKAKARGIAENFSALLDAVEAAGCTGRDLALVKTKLEEACFCAKRGMASLPENQEPS